MANSFKKRHNNESPNKLSQIGKDSVQAEMSVKPKENSEFENLSKE